MHQIYESYFLGKTSLLRRYVDGMFRDSTKSTIGGMMELEPSNFAADFVWKDVTDGEKHYRLNVGICRFFDLVAYA